MTAIMNRPDIPEILPAKHARPGRLQTLAARLRAVVESLVRGTYPWSRAVDVTLLALLGAGMCWEVWEFATAHLWVHMAVSCGCLIAAAVHMLWAFTTDRED